MSNAPQEPTGSHASTDAGPDCAGMPDREPTPTRWSEAPRPRMSTTRRHQQVAAVLTFGLGLSFLPLILVFRLGGPVRHRRYSQLPSVGEVCALLVLGFQIGFAVDLLGFQQVERVEAGVMAPANA